MDAEDGELRVLRRWRGGFGVVNVADENEMQQIMLEYPFALLDKVELRVVVDGDVSLKRWGEAIQQMAAGG
jgi:hypothetical protein